MINITRDYESIELEDNIERFERRYDRVIQKLHIKRDNLLLAFDSAITICQWWSFDLTEENKQNP